MINWRANDCPRALLYIAAAPLLLFAAMLMIIISKLALRIFGQDPLGELALRYPEEWAVVSLTSRCTLGLLFVGLLFRGQF
jgi:hypothetical protein